MTPQVYKRLLEELPIPGCSYFSPNGYPKKLGLAGDHKLLGIQQLKDFLRKLGVIDTDIEIVYGVRPKNAPANRYVVLITKPTD